MRNPNRVKGGAIDYWHVESLSISIKRLEVIGATVHRGTKKTELEEFTCVLLDLFKNLLGLTSCQL